MDHNTEDQSYRKLILLYDILRKLQKAAVAYSGGIDSTFLLNTAVNALGSKNVIALHAVSCLNGRLQRKKALMFFKKAFPVGVQCKEIVFSPLQWGDFTENTGLRCYYCKRRIYTRFLHEIERDHKDHHLLDGTNIDEMSQSRPGLQAIRELAVSTPLADAGLAKTEIRYLAQQAGLPNYAESSNSCLATRIGEGQRIEASLLEKIDAIEIFLDEHGFSATRCRVMQECIRLEIRREDLQRFSSQNTCRDVQAMISACGLGNRRVDIVGR